MGLQDYYLDPIQWPDESHAEKGAVRHGDQGEEARGDEHATTKLAQPPRRTPRSIRAHRRAVREGREAHQRHPTSPWHPFREYHGHHAQALDDTTAAALNWALLREVYVATDDILEDVFFLMRVPATKLLTIRLDGSSKHTGKCIARVSHGTFGVSK